MPQKSRYTVEEKVRIVCGYMEGQISPSEFERTYGVNQRVLRDWVRLYKVRGIEGLTPATHTRKYSPEQNVQRYWIIVKAWVRLTIFAQNMIFQTERYSGAG